MKNDLEPGKIINQAYKIIRRTYQEINSMKDDFADILKGIDPRIKFCDEYSYGPKSLYLKDFHVFLFKREEEENRKGEFMVSIIIIFSPLWGIKKTSSVEGPEVWICKMETKNIEEKATPWHIVECLGIDHRKYFTEKNLEIGGKIYNFHWKEEDGEEEWTGQFIGYQLTDIKDKTFIKEKIIDKLLIKSEQ